jgi:hypothetical protein
MGEEPAILKHHRDASPVRGYVDSGVLIEEGLVIARDASRERSAKARNQ